MEKTIVFSGIGGQGVLTSGRVLANLAMKDGKQMIYLPSYGSEMRGGYSVSTVKISENRIKSVIKEEIDFFIVLEESALKDKKLMTEGGIVLINSDLVDYDTEFRPDLNVYKVACNTLAKEIGQPRAMNFVALGAALKILKMFDIDFAIKTMSEYFTEQGKDKFIDSNKKAIRKGYKNVIKA